MLFYARVLRPLLWGLFAALVTPAHADLTITGGTPAQQRRVRQAYDALPSCCHASRRLRVQLLSGPDMNAYLQRQAAAQGVTLPDAGAIDGLYQNATPTITLRAASPTADPSPTFTHEYGHYLWLNVLSPGDRDRYGGVYSAQCRAHHLISAYAAVSVDEGFAEAFSFYVREQPVLARCDALSCCFLSSVLHPATKPGGSPPALSPECHPPKAADAKP